MLLRLPFETLFEYLKVSKIVVAEQPLRPQNAQGWQRKITSQPNRSHHYRTGEKGYTRCRDRMCLCRA